MGNLRDGSTAMERSTILRKSLHCFVVAASLAAWFALSNHCALAISIAAENADAGMSDCPMHAAPAKKKPAAKTPCCKDIRALVAKGAAKVLSFNFRAASPTDYPVAMQIAPPGPVSFVISALDTGPPPAASFAEIVLQESMLAHAPPLS